MKYSVFAIYVAFSFSVVAYAQSAAEKTLYERLADGPDQVKALDTILLSPDGYSPLILYFASNVALKEKRIEDSAYLFYAGRFRARFDKECFPPKETGANSPFVLYAALAQQIGSVVNPVVMTEPKAFANAIDRIKKFIPLAPMEYDPGYEFTERKSEKESLEATKAGREEFISFMSDLSSLLNDAEYFAAFRIVQAYNLTRDNKRPTMEENEKATEAMKQIEKEKGLKGFFSK